MKITTIVGARPQFIKASVVSRAIQAYNLLGDDHITERLVHTGQHYDDKMSQCFFDELGMKSPDINLAVGSGPHGEQTGKMISTIESDLIAHRPDCVLLYGDTNSTLAGAIAASKLNIPIAHVEAGLRSYNRNMPEEINRILTDRVSSRLYAPTFAAVGNLYREGYDPDLVVNTGDVMYDAALHYQKVAAEVSTAAPAENYILCTVHRAENTDDLEKLQAIVESLCDLSKEYNIIFPMHPRTKKVLRSAQMYSLLGKCPRISLRDPVGYLDMVSLEVNAQLILTDSGGVQKEAFFHKTPCVTLREETEWVETLSNGCNRLVPPTNADLITKAVKKSLSELPTTYTSPYGFGHAGERIVIDLVNSHKGERDV
jgi:UDP-GlcNAc3NAcA epimerase